MSDVVLTQYQEALEQCLANDAQTQPQWLRELKIGHMSRFLEKGLPKRRVDENWKYTDVSSLAKTEFTLTRQQSAIDKAWLNQQKLPEIEHCAVFIDGQFSDDLSQLASLPEGVRVVSMDKGMAQAVETLKPFFKNEALTTAGSSFVSLNTALAQQGVLIDVEPGVQVETPIQLLFVTTEDEQPCMNHLRHVINLGENSEAVIFESYHGAGQGKHFNNVVSQIQLAEKACLRYTKLQQENANTHHIAHTQVLQAQHSHFEHFSVSLGSALARDDLHVDLQGEGAHCELKGCYWLRGKQHVDHHTRIDHSVPNTTSRELYKGILDERSHGVFNGKVIVHPDAQNTCADQTNNNLLLTASAEIDTKPELEIYADSVRCTHGATVGQLDEKALFYLRSRGLSEDEAKQLLIKGFVCGLLEDVKDDAIKHRLEAEMEQKDEY